MLRVLHFSASTDIANHLRKIKPIMEAIQVKFSSLLVPYQDLCIAESMMPWREQFSFCQYIPSKRHRCGVEMLVLCDVKTGYVLKFIFYTGCATSVTVMKELGFSGSVILEMLLDYFGKRHSLFVDR